MASPTVFRCKRTCTVAALMLLSVLEAPSLCVEPRGRHAGGHGIALRNMQCPLDQRLRRAVWRHRPNPNREEDPLCSRTSEYLSRRRAQGGGTCYLRRLGGSVHPVAQRKATDPVSGAARRGGLPDFVPGKAVYVFSPGRDQYPIPATFLLPRYGRESRAIPHCSIFGSGMISAEHGAADKRLVDLGQRAAEERIAALIVHMMLRCEQRGEMHGDTFAFPMSQQQIADFTGLTPVHACRVLSSLRRRSICHVGRGIAKIIDRDELESMGSLK